jgi:hypothetical protein
MSLKIHELEKHEESTYNTHKGNLVLDRDSVNVSVRFRVRVYLQYFFRSEVLPKFLTFVHEDDASSTWNPDDTCSSNLSPNVPQI